MTPSGFLTDEAWIAIVPLLIQGLRHQVAEAGATVGIDQETCAKLMIGLSFDGFKSHVKNLAELQIFAENKIFYIVEGRDSSEMNQVVHNHTTCMFTTNTI